MKPWIGLALATLVVACSSSSSDGPSGPAEVQPPPGASSGNPSNPPPPPPEHDSGPPPFSTASHAPLPQVVNLGGPVYAAPKFVGITFAGDALEKQIDDFMSKVGASDYWKTVMKDYGVGAGTGSMVHLKDAAPVTIDDDQIVAWLQQNLTATGTLGAPDPAAIYTIFYPETTTITQGGEKGCEAFGGYHFETKVGATTIAYAVIPRCKDFAGLNGIDMVTMATSHELVEASSDPHPGTEPAYADLDAQNMGWGLVFGSENADMCAGIDRFSVKPADLPFTVARIWSNTSAKNGTDPCVPAEAGNPYFNASAALPDTITLQGPTPQEKLDLKGLKLAVGASKTFQLDLFSDRPTAEWKLAGVDMAMGSPILEISFDKGNGKNGDKVNVTVKLLKKPDQGIEPFMIQSKLGDTMNYWVGIVGE